MLIRLSFIVLTVLQLSSGTAFCQKNHPNVIYILTDDLGYGDVKCLNPDGKIATPNIDKLAAGGMSFIDAHSGSAVCTPTRYGVLTGRYAWRTRLQTYVLVDYSPPLISNSTTTVAHLFKQAGYKTACIGKWHLGLGWQSKSGAASATKALNPDDVDFEKKINNSPLQHGFDYFYGVGASLDMEPYVYIENDRVINTKLEKIAGDNIVHYRPGFKAADFVFDKSLETLTEKTIDFIDKNKENPFFVYLPLPSPHTPLVPGKAFVGKSNIDVYADYVMETDWAVEQIVKALEDKKLSENTLIIFTSDNGYAPYAHYEKLLSVGHNPNHVYRGAKADIFEGGHRVPYIVKWPGNIEAGTENNTVVCLNDFMATVADLLQIKLKAAEAPDSYSFLPALSHKKVKRKFTIHHSIDGSFAIRKDDWKLIFCSGSGGWSAPKNDEATKKGLPKYQLYNLKTDISEKNNLQAQYPDLVKELEGLLLRTIENGRSTKGKKLQNDVNITVWK